MNPAKECLRGDWYRVGTLGLDALYALSPVSDCLDSAWMGTTPARSEFAAGLWDQKTTVVSVWDGVREELWDTFSAEPEQILVWVQ